MLPEYLGDIDQVRVREVRPELTGIGGLAAEVELVVDGLVVLLHHFDRPQPRAFLPIPVCKASQGVQKVEIPVDDLVDARPQDLYHHLGTVVQPRRVCLGHRGRGKRLRVETGKMLRQRLAVGPLDDGSGHLARKRRYPVLEPSQFGSDIFGQQVRPARQHLAELDENRPQLLQRLADALTPRRQRLAPPAPGSEPQHEAVGPEKRYADDEVVQTMLDHDPGDVEYPEQAHDKPRPTASSECA
jgi:hypothetical protein